MAYKITVRPSGREFTVEGDETILAAALRSGVGLPYGCKNGACGTCKSTVLSGTWHQGVHSTSALNAQEAARNRLLICCSKPTSEMEIEARELSGFGDIPIRRMPARITRIDRVAPDVSIISLQLPGSERLQFRAGQYLEFILKDGVRRSYSMATAPHADEQISLHVRHMPGGVFTDALFGIRQPQVKERDIVRIEAPLGSFFLREDNLRPILLLASGTGFAPIKAIAEHIFFKRINRDEAGKPAQPVVLYWGCRARRDLYLPELPQTWADEQPNFSYIPVLSDATPEDAWTGRAGFVHRAVMEDFTNLSAHQVYACGAPIMVDAARNDFIAERGLPPDQFFADAFTSQADLVQG